MEKGLLHKQIMDFFVRNFDVRQDKEDELDTIESIKKGVEFKGTNGYLFSLHLWPLSD